eukprot:7252295-Pyramimonas_sp.AAC.1
MSPLLNAPSSGAGLLGQPARSPRPQQNCLGERRNHIVSTAVVNIVFGEAPYVATKRVTGAPKLAAEPHAKLATAAFGRAPPGATKRLRGVLTWGRNRGRTLPLQLSVEL